MSTWGLLRALIFVGLAIGALELSGAVYSRVVLGVGYAGARADRERYLAGIPGDALANALQRRDVIVNNIPREIHPYFGFTQVRDRPGTNNHGFRSSVDYPYRAGPSEFVVGIFGGSVSLQLSAFEDSRRRLEDGLLELVAARGFERVRVLTLGAGGWRQPQSFYAFVYFAESLDMAIFLDGFNEIASLREEHVRGWPARYPWSSVYRHFARPEYSVESLLALGELSFLGREARRWARQFDHPLLARSLFAHAVWRAHASAIDAEIQAKRLRVEGLQSGAIYQSLVAGDEREARTQAADYLAFYEDLSRWQALIARAKGIPLFHFLQPNQYVRGSKPYSELERARYLARGEDWMDFVTPRYADLDAVMERLRASGQNAVSLRAAFRETRETVYADDCCHVNALGRRLLADRILEAIEASGALAAVAPPSD